MADDDKKKDQEKEAELQKQMLEDFEKLLKNDLGSLMALNGEGSSKQLEAARNKIRGDLLKYAPEMKKMAEKMGGQFSGAVDEFLKSIDGVLGSMGQWVDQAKVNDHFKAVHKLDNQLHKKEPPGSGKKV